MKIKLVTILIFLLCTSYSFAEIVKKIEIEGNERVNTETIKIFGGVSINEDLNTDDLEIYIKCDIEGSEFKVLPCLLKSEYIKFVKEIYIEWHERFFLKSDNYNEILDKKNEIINNLDKNEIKYFNHH